MTLDGLIERLQEIRANIGHDCDIKVEVKKWNKYTNGTLSMVASDYRDGVNSTVIQIDYVLTQTA